MELYSGIDANGNLTTTEERWHHDDQKNALFAQNATNALNYALARQQNQWNIDQWEREMQYNSPVNQLKLLQEAGLNPLFYGQGLGSNSRTQAPQSADMSVAGDFYQSQEQAKMANVVGLIQSLNEGAGNFLKQKEMQLASLRLDQDIQESRSRIASNYASSDLSKANTRSVLNGLKLQDVNYEATLKSIAQTEASIKSINETARSVKLNNDYFEKTWDEQVKKLKFQNAEIKARIDNLVKDTWLKGKQGDLTDMQTQLQEILKDNEEFMKLPNRAKGLFFGAALKYLNRQLQLFDDSALDMLFDDLSGQGRSTRNPQPDFGVEKPDAVTGESVSEWKEPEYWYHVRDIPGVSRTKQ